MDIVCPVAHERFSVADVNILEYRLDNCPLVPVPQHGRLIDQDALIESLEMELKRHNDYRFTANWNDACLCVVTAPTIIPVSEEDET